jgi:glycosyltransferase involved in cell wall biosynthesis
MSGARSLPRTLFLVENVPLELDSRVRRETATLVEAGFGVTVICPGEAGQAFHETVDGVRVYRYRRREYESLLGHLVEYCWSLAAHTALSVVALLRGGFDVVHIANPPDLLWLVAAPYRLANKRVIFDQHEPVPELFVVRFPSARWLLPLIRWVERMNYVVAHHVIAINETCREIAIDRGKKRPEAVTIVRNGPRLTQDFPPVAPDASVRAKAEIMVGYLGIMNEQDDARLFIELAHIVRTAFGRTDIGFVMVGTGDAFERLRRLRDELGLSDAVEMTGRIPWELVLRVFAATDICVQPDLPNVFNAKSTMNKLMEYMAFGKPTVAFDLTETRASAEDAAVYVTQHDAAGLAEAVVALADDPARRARLGAAGRRRIEDTLAWEHQAANLLSAYEAALGARVRPAVGSLR